MHNNTPVEPFINSNQDIVVIGAGIIGLCTALSLQKTQRNVLLISDDSDLSPASYGNAGHIACEQITPLASLSLLKNVPSMLINPLGPISIDIKQFPHLIPWFAQFLYSLRNSAYTKSCQALQTLNQHALSAWQTLLKEENLSDLLKINGSYLVAEKPKSLNHLYHQVKRFEQSGVMAEPITQNNLLKTVPALNTHQLGGLFFPETAHTVDPKILCSSIKKQFVSRGGKLLNDKVLSVKNQASSVDIQCTNTPNIKAYQAIIACGIHSKNLVKIASKITPPLQAERGYHIMAELPKASISAPVTSFDRRFIMTPMTSGLRLAGTIEYSTPHKPPNYQKAHQLHTLANGLLKSPLTIKPNTEWMGSRPTLPDSLPVIDKINHIGYAFGHQHLGLTQAAITARWMTQLMNHQANPIDLSAYQLNRFKH